MESEGLTKSAYFEKRSFCNPKDCLQAKGELRMGLIDLFQKTRETSMEMKPQEDEAAKVVTCKGCGAELKAYAYGKNLYVCPHCGRYGRLLARTRIRQIADKDSFEELYANLAPADPIHFPGYAEKTAELAEKKAKTRSEVSGGGRKPWRQKGTGHARQGSIRAPQWTGGGVVFAPVPRDYEVKMNKKERRAALKSALTSKVQENKLVVVDSLALAEAKTKEMQKVLTNLKADKALVVTADDDQKVVLSARNIADVQTATVNTINVYDVMKHNTVVVTKDAVASIEEVYA